MTMPAVPAALSVSSFLTSLVEASVQLVELVSTLTQVDSLTIVPTDTDRGDGKYLQRYRLIVALAADDSTTPLAALTAHEYFGANQTHVFVDKVDTSGLGAHHGLARGLVTAYLQSMSAALSTSAWYLHVYAKSAPTYLFPTASAKRILSDPQLTQWWQTTVDQALWGHPLERFCFTPVPPVAAKAAGAPARNAWANGFPGALYPASVNPQTCILDLPDHELARLAKADTARGVATLAELLQVWSGLVEAKGGNEQPACLTVQVLPKVGEAEGTKVEEVAELTLVEAAKVDKVVKTMLAYKWGGAEESQVAAAKALQEAVQASGAVVVAVKGTKVPHKHQSNGSSANPAEQAPVVNTLSSTLIKKKRTAANDDGKATNPNKKAKVEQGRMPVME